MKKMKLIETTYIHLDVFITRIAKIEDGQFKVVDIMNIDGYMMVIDNTVNPRARTMNIKISTLKSIVYSKTKRVM